MKIYFYPKESDLNKRIDIFLSENMDKSRSGVQNLIKNNKVFANDKIVKANYKITNENLEIIVEEEEPKDIKVVPQDIPLDLLYEDEDVLIVNKPKGMVVHPAPGHPDNTLVNAVLYHCKGELPGINGEIRPGIVHRIDQNTTGSLVIAKTEKALNSLAEQFKSHSITREYVAIVIDNIKEDEGTIETTIGRSLNDRKKMSINVRNGRDAITHFKVLERFGEYTYVSCRLETGRTHQIRVHMASIKHPVLGDVEYGPKKSPIKNLQGQTLHARVLGFIHPTTGKYIEVSAPLPEYFEKLLNKFRKK